MFCTGGGTSTVSVISVQEQEQQSGLQESLVRRQRALRGEKWLLVVAALAGPPAGALCALRLSLIPWEGLFMFCWKHHRMLTNRAVFLSR